MSTQILHRSDRMVDESWDRPRVAGSVAAPERTSRRAGRPGLRRPPVAPVRSDLRGDPVACDRPHAASSAVDGVSELPYRMSRRARLAVTVTVLVTAVILAAALVSGSSSGTRSVTVSAGDSLWLIAQRAAPDGNTGDILEEIMALNGLDSSIIQPGQKLLVPVP